MKWITVWLTVAATMVGGNAGYSANASVDDRLIVSVEPGRRGGALRIAQRAEPRTFNPVFSTDTPSREVLGRLHASLLRINRVTQQNELELARALEVSPDGRRYTVRLRRSLRFSDGEAFDADDVVFTFRVLLDPKVGSPQRDLLVVGGRPIDVRKIDTWTVQFDLAEPYAAAERLFDGIAMLPEHRLAGAHAKGALASAWSTNADPGEIAGLGPFRLAARVPGQRILLERNPHYWKIDRMGTSLPYIERIELEPVPTDAAQVLRFRAGQSDLLTRFAPAEFAALAREAPERRLHVQDLGPGLEYTFLFFNQNEVSAQALPRVAERGRWFRERAFRQAVSRAIDRDSLARLVFDGRAAAIWGHVTPGNPRWINARLPRPARSLEAARALLRGGGFRWHADGALVDRAGRPVAFTIVTNASNTARVQLAAVIQDDLRQIGIRVEVVPLEFRALVDRLTRTFDYDACILGLGGGDTDPNPEMNVWLSSGGNHLWRPAQAAPSTPWEAEIDDLMRRQLVARDPVARKRLYDRVQEIVAEELPLICLVSPHILVGTRAGLANVRPATVDHQLLWNAEELFWR